MAASLEKLNPWESLAAAWLDAPLGRFLDYGCGPGRFLELVETRCTECHGVDVDEPMIREAAARLPRVRLGTIDLDGKCAYPDGYFDTAALLEVIEHVPDERATLAEVARVLRPGGRLMLTTPHRGWLTFLDVGNLKFLFPTLHRFVHRNVLKKEAEYEERFGRVGARGLVGDISATGHRRPWHRHYRAREVERFAREWFSLERCAVYFPGMRAIGMLRMFWRVMSGGRCRELPRAMLRLERRLSEMESGAGDQLVMMLRRR